MKITKVAIHNWKSIKDVEIEFQDLMIFIGQNNHGKSNILSAILFFFGVTTCTELDFNKGCDEMYVEVTFTDLDEHDKNQFAKYVTTNGIICVRKSMIRGDTFEYHGYTQIPADAWLKEENIANYLNREAVSVTPLNTYIPTAGRITKDMVKQAQAQYIAANEGTINFNYELEKANFLGLKTVAQGIFGNIFFVPAVKSASEEFNVKGKSIFNQLLTNVINDMSASNRRYIDVKNKVRELTQTLNKTIGSGEVNADRPTQITKLESLLETELSNWHTTIDIEITPPDVDEILRVGTNVLINDGIATDVTRKGNGLQRSLIFALIKAWAKIASEEKIESPEDGDVIRKASRSNYFIFEEPELYLHPQAQRELYHSLKKLTESKNQVLLSTHASAFIDLELYKSICIVYKENPSTGTKHLQCTEDLFQDLDDQKRFNMTYWINPDRGELFFAKKVILVEGPTEKTVISYLAKELGIFKYNYTLIDCGGKSIIPIYVHLLNKFKLPYIAVYDIDHQEYKGTDGINSADKESKKIEEKIDLNYGSSVKLENDIEEEIGIVDSSKKNKPFIAMEHISEPTFCITESFKQKLLDIYR